MSNLNNSKLGKFLSSKGFYIALAICIVGAGTAAWVAIDTTMNSISAQDEKKLETTPPVSSVAEQSVPSDWGFSSLNQVEKKVKDEPVEKKASSSSSVSSSAPQSSASSSEPAENVLKQSDKRAQSQNQQPAQQPLAYSMPILAEVFNPYSNGELVKNKTLGDWRTHDGIDIKAEKGTDVMACADGEISRIYDDALWGTCIEIEHAGGLTSLYCGVDKATVSHKEGDAVKLKEVIGKVDKVPCEISLDNHLHFAMKQDGKWADPVVTMGLS